ncbi:MAG TPA: hypothetical protein PLW81_12635 [Thiobacillaceae bacterium]|nr:hypothetical protein [Thiobacillaceae bacterium]
MNQAHAAGLTSGRHVLWADTHLPRLLVWVATLVFLASYFITKGPTTTEADLINLTYLETVTIGVLLAIRHFLWRDDVLERIVWLALPVYFLLALHVLMINDGNEMAYMIKLTRLFGYLVMVVLFVCCFFQWRVFLQGLYWFSIASAGLALCSALLFPQYFSDVGYGFPRARAMLSEPSAFGPVLPMLLFLSIYRRNWLGVLLALSATYMAASGTVYFVLVMAGTLLLLKHLTSRSMPRKFWVALASLTTGVLVLHMPLHHALSGIFNYDRAIGQIQAVVFEYGGSTRLSSLFNYAFLFYEEDGLWFGKGLNAATVFFAEVPEWNLHMVSEFSLLHAVFFAFGLTGLAVLGALLTYTLSVLWRHGSMEMLIVFSCFLFASLLNSSGGHVLYKFVYIFMLLALQRAWQLRAARQKSIPVKEQGCRTILSLVPRST